jgi:hypothetical protein
MRRREPEARLGDKERGRRRLHHEAEAAEKLWIEVEGLVRKKLR